MASDSNSVVDHCVVEGDHMSDHHSTDLKHSNISQKDFSEGDNKPCSPTSLDLSLTVSTTDLNIAPNEPEIVLKSTSSHSDENESSEVIQKVFPEDNESTQVILTTPAKETESTQEMQSSFIEEIQVTISQEDESVVVNQPALAKKNKSIQKEESVFSEKAGSTQIIQQEYSQETESASVILSGCSNETESTQEIHGVLAENSLSNEVIESSVSEQTKLTGKIKQVLEEDCVSNEVTESSVSMKTRSNQENQRALLEDNVSTEVIQSSVSVQVESTPVIQQTLEESLSTEVLRSSISVKTESTPEIQSVLEDRVSKEVTESSVSVITEEIPAPVSEKNSSTIAIKPIRSEKTESSKLIKGSHKKKTKPTEVKKLADSDVDQNKEFPLDISEPICSTKSLVTPSGFETHYIHSHAAVNTYGGYTVERSPLKPLKIDIESCNKQYIYDSFFQSPDSFRSLLDTEEYKNGSLYVIPGKGQVIVTPSAPLPPPDPFFAKLFSSIDFENPSMQSIKTESLPLSSSTKNPLSEPIKNPSPHKDPTVPDDACLYRSLSTLMPQFAKWVQRVMEKPLFNLEQPNLEDFVDYCSTELKSGIDILKEMHDRVNCLIKAALFLPDPTSISEGELGNGKVSDHLVQAAFTVQRKVKVLKAKTTENYNKLVELKPCDAVLSNEYALMQQGMKAKNMFLNLFVELSEDVLTLSSNVKDFRESIREFCFELEKRL